MKNRIKQKLEKKALNNDSTPNYYFAKVTASLAQLWIVGINDDLTGKVVKVLSHYHTGYAQIIGTPHSYLKTEQLWDIPVVYLDEI